MKNFFYGLCLLLSLGFTGSYGQNILFGRPFDLLPEARTDAPVALANFHQAFFAFWKEPGVNAVLKGASFGRNSQAVYEQHSEKLPEIITDFAPASIATEETLFLFWIDSKGQICWLARHKEESWLKQQPKILPLKNEVTSGLTVTMLADGRIALGSRKKNSNKLVLLLLENDDAGELRTVKEMTVKMARTTTYPNVSAEGQKIMVSWARMEMLHFTVYDTETDSWTENRAWTGTEVGGVPSVFRELGSGKTVWTWRKTGKTIVQQYMVSGYAPENNIADFPSFFEPAAAVTFAGVDHNNFIMAYPGADQKLYFSYGSGYEPARWMEQYFFPHKENYTLKDIVLPGAHDAGMSVLSGRGGKSGYTINECNTLTQVAGVADQLEAGLRMFDLRIDLYQNELYTKHAPAPCMNDAVGGGWGEPLKQVLEGVRRFLDRYNKEIVLLSFAHLCDRNMPLEKQADFIVRMLGTDKVFRPDGRKLTEIPLKDLAGKVIITFEGEDFPAKGILSNTMTRQSDAFINYVREYAATNSIDTFLMRQERFLKRLQTGVADNDYIRLDWQLTQIGQEAAISCSHFQSSKSNPLLDGSLLLTNMLTKNKSIIELARIGNRYLPGKVDSWIKKGLINAQNKPNILYVDVAGSWITDFCIDLNESALYTRKVEQ